MKGIATETVVISPNKIDAMRSTRGCNTIFLQHGWVLFLDRCVNVIQYCATIRTNETRLGAVKFRDMFWLLFGSALNCAGRLVEPPAPARRDAGHIAWRSPREAQHARYADTIEAAGA